MYSNRSTITPLGPPHLAWENVSKGTEGVVQCLIVDGFVQVLDENVSDTWATERGVTLRPHNSHWTSLDGVEVHGIQSSFSWCGGVGRGKEEEREKWTQKGKEWKKGGGGRIPGKNTPHTCIPYRLLVVGSWHRRSQDSSWSRRLGTLWWREQVPPCWTSRTAWPR